MNTNPTVGRIVHFFPGTNESNQLPNGMKFAPAIVTQTWESGSCNLTLFLAEPDVNKNPMPQKWSVQHKTQISSEEIPHWDWPEIK